MTSLRVTLLGMSSTVAFYRKPVTASPMQKLPLSLQPPGTQAASEAWIHCAYTEHFYKLQLCPHSILQPRGKERLRNQAPCGQSRVKKYQGWESGQVAWNGVSSVYVSVCTHTHWLPTEATRECQIRSGARVTRTCKMLGMGVDAWN